MRDELGEHLYIRMLTAPRTLIRAYGGTSTSRRREPSSGLMIAERLADTLLKIWIVADRDGERVTKPGFVPWLADVLNGMPDDLAGYFAGKDGEASRRAGKEIGLRAADAIIERHQVSREIRAGGHLLGH